MAWLAAARQAHVPCTHMVLTLIAAAVEGRGATTHSAKYENTSFECSCRPIGVKEQKGILPKFASVRGQAVAVWHQPGGAKENVNVTAVMPYFLYLREGDLVALPVHAPQHGFTGFPVLSASRRPFA